MLHEIRSLDSLVVKVSDHGAQLESIYDEKLGLEYLWQADPSVWARHAPVLFPFIARLYEAKYEYKGKQYDMARHGFAVSSDFTVTALKSDSITLSLDCMRENWPFDCTFSVTYAVSGKSLEVLYSVFNKGKETAYFAVGSHPGFNIPLEEGLEFEDYYAYFPEAGSVKRAVFTDSGLDTGERESYSLDDGKLALRHDLFDHDAVIMQNTGSTVVLKSDKGRRGVKVEYPSTAWCALWHKDHMKAPYVCVEPWSSLPGRDGIVEDIEKKGDLVSLGPDSVYQMKMIVTVF